MLKEKLRELREALWGSFWSHSYPGPEPGRMRQLGGGTIPDQDSNPVASKTVTKVRRHKRRKLWRGQ
jgi:hypothetical protein